MLEAILNSAASTLKLLCESMLLYWWVTLWQAEAVQVFLDVLTPLVCEDMLFLIKAQEQDGSMFAGG